MADTSRSDKQLKRTAALLASRPGVVDHVRRTGQLPAKIPSGGMHIGHRLLIEQRGWDIELREDEQLVYDALVRDQKQRPKKRQTRTVKDRERFPRLDLIYGNAQVEAVAVERDELRAQLRDLIAEGRYQASPFLCLR